MVPAAARCLAFLLFSVVVAFPLDWIVWRIRVAAGSGLERVTVQRVTIASLKGNKDEYYMDGAAEVECSRSLFPQAGAGACWWLRHHDELVRRE